MRSEHVIVWDLETVPDLEACRRIWGMPGASDIEVREKLGDSFPKLPLHKIACIGAVVAKREPAGWRVTAIGAPHIGERSEGDLIQSFVDRIKELSPLLVSFNGASFDLPVLRYRAMINRVSAPGLRARRYFYRYSDDSLDLCDVLASFESRAKPNLNDLSLILGLSGKPEGIDGSQVEAYVNEGRIQEVADYCETDVVSTFRIWLLYEQFQGTITPSECEWSEEQLKNYVVQKRGDTLHLQHAIGLS